MLWVIRSTQVGYRDPRHSKGLGAARTVCLELLIDLATSEMDTLDPSALNLLFNKVSLRRDTVVPRSYLCTHRPTTLSCYDRSEIDHLLRYKASGLFQLFPCIV